MNMLMQKWKAGRMPAPSPEGTAAPGGAAPNGTAAAPATPAAPAAPTTGGQYVPHSAYRALKESERKKGRTAALAPFEQRAKALGYASVEEMLAAAAPKSGAPPAPAAARPAAPPPANKPGGQPGNGQPGGQGKGDKRVRQLEAEAAKLREQAEQNKRKAVAAEEKAKAAAEEVENEKLVYQMRLAALKAGVKPERLDQAVFMLDRRLGAAHMAGDTAYLDAFDEEKFFTGLKETEAYLWDEPVKPAPPPTPPPAPATTGNIPGGAPPTPSPTAARAAAAAAGKWDPNKATPEEVRQRIQSLGLKID